MDTGSVRHMSADIFALLWDSFGEKVSLFFLLNSTRGTNSPIAESHSGYLHQNRQKDD